MHNNNKQSDHPFLFSTAGSIKTLCNHTRLIMGLEDSQVMVLQQQREMPAKTGINKPRLLNLLPRLSILKQGMRVFKQARWQHG